jgi:hypothetical protein
MNSLAFLDDGNGEMEAKIVWTPEMAEEALTKHNKRDQQRNMIPASIDKYSHEMIDGTWIEDWYQTWIAFEVGTKFIQNGQHTLKSIVTSGKSISVRTAWNVPPERMKNWDMFKARTLTLLIKQAGMNYQTDRAALARMILHLDEGRIVGVTPTVDDIHRLTMEDQTADAIVRIINSHAVSKEFGSNAAIEYALLKIAQANSLDIACKFYETVADGINLNEVDPRLHLARFLRSRRGVVTTPPTRYQNVVGIIKAFNAWALNKPMSLCRVLSDEQMQQPVQMFALQRAAKRDPNVH